MDAYNRYAELEEQEDLSAPEKATEYARWLDGQKYTQKQKKLLGESFAFYSHIPAEAGQYAKMTDAGLSSSAAYELTKSLSELTPEEGKKQVSDLQRFRKIDESTLSEQDKLAAIGAIMGTELTNESGSPSQYAKMLAVLDEGASLSEYLDLQEIGRVDLYLEASEAGMSSQNAIRVAKAIDAIPENSDGTTVSILQKQEAAVQAVSGVQEQIRAYAVAGSQDEYEKNVARLTKLYESSSLTPAQYVRYRKAVQGLDAKGTDGKSVTNLKKARVIMAIAALGGLTKEQRDALYLDAGYNGKDLGKALWNSGKSYRNAEEYAKVL